MAERNNAGGVQTAGKSRKGLAIWIIAGVLVVGGVAAVLLCTDILSGKDDKKKHKAPSDDDTELVQEEEIVYDDWEDVPDDWEDVPDDYEEPLPEDLDYLSSPIQNTCIVIVDDEEPAPMEELLEAPYPVGAYSDGIDDLTRQAVIQDVVIEDPKPAPESDKVYYVANVQQQPSFPGGEAALYKWISDNIVYPEAAAEEGVEGRVIVEFVVTKTGEITNVRVVRGRHPALDKEAVRIVKSMPRWNPGRNNGECVNVSYNLPVSFKLTR